MNPMQRKELERILEDSPAYSETLQTIARVLIDLSDKVDRRYIDSLAPSSEPASPPTVHVPTLVQILVSTAEKVEEARPDFFPEGPFRNGYKEATKRAGSVVREIAARFASSPAPAQDNERQDEREQREKSGFSDTRSRARTRVRDDLERVLFEHGQRGDTGSIVDVILDRLLEAMNDYPYFADGIVVLNAVKNGKLADDLETVF